MAALDQEASEAEPKTFRERVIRLRELTGLNQSQLSLLCGFPRSYIGLVEKERVRELGAGQLLAIRLSLGVSLDWVVGGLGEPPKEKHVREAVRRAERDPEAHARAIEAARAAAWPAPTPAPTPSRRAKPVVRRSPKRQVAEQLDEQRPKPRARKRAASAPPVEATPS